MSKSRDQLEQEKIGPKALEQIVTFHAEAVQEVKEAIAHHEWVVLGMAHNPYVIRARKLLKQKGKKFHYIEKGSYLSGWKVRLAIKLYTGSADLPPNFS